MPISHNHLMMPNNLFKGETAILDYLNPQHTLTPLVEVPPCLNPFFSDDVHIFAKLLQTLPLTNVKSLPAFQMLANEDISAVHTLIESSSGNTVLSLAVMARILGIPTTKAIVSHEITPGKKKLLQLFGVEMIVHQEAICPNPNDSLSGISLAKKYGKQSGRINPGQYDNPKNPEAHYTVTGPQIYEQLQGDLQLFCAGLGTTGTMMGTAAFLKEKNNRLQRLGVVRKPNNPVPGVRTQHLLRQIAFQRKESVDVLIAVGTRLSYQTSLNLIRQGIVVGPSSGFALAGMLQFLEQCKANGTLDTMRAPQGHLNAVFCCGDTPFPYLDEYFQYLDPQQFPAIQYEERLLNPEQKKHQPSLSHQKNTSITCTQLYQEAFERGAGTCLPRLREGFYIYDIRTKAEYLHVHVPDAEWIENEELLKKQLLHIPFIKCFIICNYGMKSADMVVRLSGISEHIMSVEGGIVAWSDEGLPRWKAPECTT